MGIRLLCTYLVQALLFGCEERASALVVRCVTVKQQEVLLDSISRDPSPCVSCCQGTKVIVFRIFSISFSEDSMVFSTKSIVFSTKLTDRRHVVQVVRVSRHPGETPTVALAKALQLRRDIIIRRAAAIFVQRAAAQHLAAKSII